MQDLLDTDVRRLNRLFSLYSYALRFSKPYRTSRIRKFYEQYVVELKGKYEILKFDSSSYADVLNQNIQIFKVLERKASAIESGNYELAALLRDQENRIVRTLLELMGVSLQDRFFHHNGRIYEFG